MKVLVSISILFLSFYTYGQKMPSDYFDESIKYFEDKKYDKALQGYQYIVENHNNNELFPKAFYNIGHIKFIQKKYEQAIPIFKKILESNFNEKESSGASLMADPYTNYKHRASRLLSDIYYNKGNYETALYYLTLSDTTYPYLHFCGNEYDANEVYLAIRYAAIYQKLKQPEKAIEKLLPAVFINLSNNSKLIEELKKLFSNKIGLKQELDIALSEIYSKEIYTENYSYTRYYFKFLNVEIAIPFGYDAETNNFDKDKAIIQIKQTIFYKMIEKF